MHCNGVCLMLCVRTPPIWWEISKQEVLGDYLPAVVGDGTILIRSMWLVIGHNGAHSCVRVPVPARDCACSQNPDEKRSLPAPSHWHQCLEVPNMPCAEPVLNLSCRRANCLSMGCIPPIVRSAEEGTERGLGR